MQQQCHEVLYLQTVSTAHAELIQSIYIWSMGRYISRNVFFFLLLTRKRWQRLFRIDQERNVYSGFDGGISVLDQWRRDGVTQRTQTSSQPQPEQSRKDSEEGMRRCCGCGWLDPPLPPPQQEVKPCWAAAAKWEKPVTGSWMKHRAEGTTHSLSTKTALLTLVMITVRNIFLWRSCLGGWATWRKHRFGYVNKHFFFLPPSSLFLLYDGKPL